MTWKTLVEKAARQSKKMDKLGQEKVSVVPAPETLALFVRLQREIMGWKQETLASFACVSLSTIERIERGEVVSAKSLDRVAEALRQPPGAFTAPRIPLNTEEAWRKLEECATPFKNTVAAPVRPLRGHQQVAKLARTHLFIVDGGRLDDACHDDLDNLREWLGFASFILTTEEQNSIIRTDVEPVKRRTLYEEVLDCVREIERRNHAVALAGTYQAETGIAAMPKANVGLVRFFPKSTDPAAIKRQTLLAPAHMNLATSLCQFLAQGE